MEIILNANFSLSSAAVNIRTLKCPGLQRNPGGADQNQTGKLRDEFPWPLFSAAMLSSGQSAG